MSNQNLFGLFESDPTVAAIKQIKTNLLILIATVVRDNNMTQHQVSQLAGITQPRVSNLMKGYLDKFSIDMLVSVASKLSCSVKSDYDEGVVTLQLGIVK